MYVVNNSSRALLVALIPLAVPVVPLPEAVIATDPNALVGADDPARHQHRVILSN
jgi:hypothetical protein